MQKIEGWKSLLSKKQLMLHHILVGIVLYSDPYCSHFTTKSFLKMNRLFSIIFFCSILCACQTESNKNELAELDSTSLSQHLETLSSDLFQGRKPGTKGEVLTVNYLALKLKEAGIAPGNGDSYFQEVPLIDITGTPSELMNITTPTGEISLRNSKDFVVHTERNQAKISLEESDMVFCGFGIVDDKLDWNDYAGVDMTGKTAVVLVNDPGFGGEDSTFFKGNTMTYYGRWTYKYEEADRQGAAGLLMIHETASAGYPWFVPQSSWSGSQQGLDQGGRDNDCGIKGWLHFDQARALFKNCGLDFTEMVKAARKPGFKPIPLDAQVSVSLENEYKKVNSKNVIGMIEGETRSDEYIVYTAHWDHLGIAKAVNNDSIYNGALDNASGTAAVLGIAEAMAKSEVKPERSVVFLFVTAEEQGLLGSKYYVDNPVFPLDKTVCNLNMDGVNPAGKMRDLTIVGMGHSDMDGIAEEAAKAQGRYIMNEAEPEKGYFFRSDHFNFAKKGVPALYAEGSYDHWEKGVEYAKSFRDGYVAERYHAPSDQYDAEEWNMEGMVQDGSLYLNIGWDLANSNQWPQWNKSSEFSRPKLAQ